MRGKGKKIVILMLTISLLLSGAFIANASSSLPESQEYLILNHPRLGEIKVLEETFIANNGEVVTVFDYIDALYDYESSGGEYISDMYRAIFYYQCEPPVLATLDDYLHEAYTVRIDWLYSEPFPTVTIFGPGDVLLDIHDDGIPQGILDYIHLQTADEAFFHSQFDYDDAMSSYSHPSPRAVFPQQNESPNSEDCLHTFTVTQQGFFVCTRCLWVR
jgi:hypothetical protein